MKCKHSFRILSIAGFPQLDGEVYFYCTKCLLIKLKALKLDKELFGDDLK